MRRRTLLVATCHCLGANGAARALGADAAVVLMPQGRARMLQRFTAAGGPLERHTARPGAWYALLYLPMLDPQAPRQLLLWSTERGHELRLFALDAAPDDAPTVLHPLPLDTETSGVGRPPRLSSRFMLPAASTAPAIYVLVEQWSIGGQQPAPLWVQLLAQRAPQRATAPWWASRDAGDTHPAGATAPPSPLAQQQSSSGARPHEVPIFHLPAAPDSGAWR